MIIIQYDFVKKMEHVGKGSMGILTGQAEPTIIQPSQYRKRFSLAMERYFMTVPGKWIPHDSAISSAAQQHLAVNKNLEEN